MKSFNKACVMSYNNLSSGWNAVVTSDLYTGQYGDAPAALEENPPEERSVQAVLTPELHMLVYMPVERETGLRGIEKKQ